MPTDIQWTDETWNCVRGCSRVSSGCGDSNGGGCYAERQAYRFSGPGMPYEGLVKMTPKGPRWTGKVVLVEDKLNQPLKWKAPRRVFVNSMSDLFHESLSFGQIFRVLMVMQQCPQHEFQVLTKRPARMKEFFEWLAIWGEATALAMGFREYYEWPYPNVWLGISCEDQQSFDERWPYLRDTPTWTRWLSLEPLLGPINAEPALIENHYYCDVSNDPDDPTPAHRCSPIANWVVVGGESGPKARPMHPDWARSLRDQCVAADVPYFFKQWGEFMPGDRNGCSHISSDGAQGPVAKLNPQRVDVWRCCICNALHGYEPGDKPFDFKRVGKKAAGRLLDGVEWNQFPEVKAVTV